MHDLNTIRRLNANAYISAAADPKVVDKIIVVEKLGLHVIDHHIFDERVQAERFAATVNLRGDSSSARIIN